MSDKGANGRLLNTFSWSFSRHNTFTECQKRYWYIYYGSWEGWPLYPRDPRPRLDPLAHYLYCMKNMQHFPMFLGSVVHNTIEKALKERQKTGKDIDLKALKKKGLELLSKGIEDSQQEAWRKSPKHRANLFETYYHKFHGEEKLSEGQIKEGKEKAERCLEHWFESPIVQNLILDPSTSWLSIEKLDSFLLDDLFKVYVVIDFAMQWQLKSSPPAILLFDWKTGKETEKTLDQLYSYALYAHKVWKYDYGQLILSPFYLDSGKYEKIGYRQTQALSSEKIESTESFIRESCKSMTDLLQKEASTEDQLKKNQLAVTDCSYTTQKYRCQRCPFKELCEAVDYQNVDAGELRQASVRLSTQRV